jgi:hypothetical protein
MSDKKSNKRKLSKHAQRLERCKQRPFRPACAAEEDWQDPAAFADALDLHMRRHRESAEHLWRAIVREGDTLDPGTIVAWRAGRKAPRLLASLRYLQRIEQRYGLPPGYFKAKLPNRAQATARAANAIAPSAEQRRLAWHLPDDFDQRSIDEQADILEWVRTTIITGATEYRRFQRSAMKHRYGLRFPRTMLPTRGRWNDEFTPERRDPDAGRGKLRAPDNLVGEMRALLEFKTATLTAPGFSRRGVWGEETAGQKVEHLGLMLGALAASPRGPNKGLGVSTHRLSLALLIFPAVWDWYVTWRETRRGFFTAWEVDMLSLAAGLTAPQTGWLKQTPHLQQRLTPLPGLITATDVRRTRESWSDACAVLHSHVVTRAKEIQRVARVHRDPFEPILPVLEADSPLSEYRKIVDEIVRLMPEPGKYPKASAEARRSLLMIRFGLHLGLRQKNLRQMLFRRRGETASTELQLTALRRGELRWSERDGRWEVFIPSIAFKNSHSSFFSGRPFRLVLPDLADLYAHIDTYIDRDRALLLGSARDPGTFFIKSVKSSSAKAEYDQNTFYEAWRHTIQRYGVYNPWTGRGAIAGLLPHGPHNVRDVLATHILKKTGSFEQASYAIQDTPDIVAKHYGRFLPENKAALAAAILDKAWVE